MRKYHSSWANGIIGYAAAAVLGAALTALILLLLSGFVYLFTDDLSLGRAIAYISLAFGGYLSAMQFGRYRRRGGLYGGLICAFLMYLLLCAAAYVITGSPADIKKLLLLAFCCAAGGVSGVNMKRPKNLSE